jgi:ethanolamine ammonia-lyase small subunit
VKPLTPDPWSSLRRHTSARIALGRAGGSLPTAEVLAFAMDHALARDAVHSELDLDAAEESLQPLGLPVIRLQTKAADRLTYLQRPDLGRRLDDASIALLNTSPRPPRPPDVALIVADGLSALAAARHAPSVLEPLVPKLQSAGFTPAPLSLVRHGRVGVQDEIGAALGARLAVILIGERPGLGTPDSLGAYLVFDPQPGARTDADRNCVSNIRPAGLPPPAAAETIYYLITQSLRRRISGVSLKDEREPLPAPGRETGLMEGG